ncbi:MAG: hypothetical protein DRN20_04375 [Thermoplasmata archaeon]|nr:MAG: hypothetical protein DRN20_04375 [Thermoplasmata archaeon]
MRILVGITGASGALYATNFIKHASRLGHEIHVIPSSTGIFILKHELGIDVDELKKYCKTLYSNDDLTAPPSSGTSGYEAMVIVPCTLSTMCKVSQGIGDNLICRAATVMLKEQRKLVLVVRDTPLSTVHIRCMLGLAEAGAVVLPASPAFYHKPHNINDLADYISAKIFDALGIKHDIGIHWEG